MYTPSDLVAEDDDEENDNEKHKTETIAVTTFCAILQYVSATGLSEQLSEEERREKKNGKI